MTDIRDEVAAAVRALPTGSGEHSYLIALDTSDDIANALLAALAARGLTVVREGEVERLREAASYVPNIKFPNLPTPLTSPDVLDAIAAWMDRIDDRDGNSNRDVQAHLREWARRLRDVLTRQPEGQ